MLTLDAEESPPSVYVVLTCRNFLTRRELRRHLEHLRRSARRFWPSLEWFCALEWQRRGAIHVNLLVKGVGAGADQLLLKVLWRVWRRRVDAVWEAQHAQPIRSVRRAVSYVAKIARYIGKPAQEPPPGWRGHRTSQTRGYLVRPASVMRPEARGSQRWKAVRGALRRAGLSLVEAAWQAVAPAAFDALSVWSFVSVPVVPQPPVRVSPSVRPPPAGGLCPVASCDPPKQRTGEQPQQPLCDASGGEFIWGGRPHWVI